MYDFSGKRVLVVGMARSGIGAAQMLKMLGAFPVLNDTKSREQFGDKLNELNGIELEWHLGEDPCTVLDTCDALVISPGVPIDSKIVLHARATGKYMIGEMELACQHLPGLLCAVTGTNGKTTTVTLLREIFEQSGKQAFAAGNIGYPITMAAMQADEESVTVAEVSSFQLESIDTFHPFAAAVLNVTEDHLIRHYTMDTYISLKRDVFKNQTASDVAVLNFDDEITRKMAEGLPSRVAFFSRKTEPAQGAFVRNGMVCIRWNGQEEEIIPAGEIYIPGSHNLENALAASMLAYVCGVKKEVIAQTLRTFRGVEHRIEYVRELDGVTYYNDSKGTNADSTVKAVDTMTKPTILLLGGYDKHVSFKGLAEHIQASPQIIHCVLLGVTKPQLDRELREAGFERISYADTFRQAVEMAKDRAKPGENVLLSPACASFDMFADFEERGRVFKDIVNHF